MDINKKYNHQITYDLPIEYNGVKIYPITMRYYHEFFKYSDVFCIDKNRIEDPAVISMTYLEFIYYVVTQINPQNELTDEAKKYLFFLREIISLSLRDPDVKIDFLEKTVPNKNKKRLFFKINEIEFSRDQFDDLKSIIMYRNNLDYDDQYINPELKDALTQGRKIKSNGSGGTKLEDQIVCLAISTNYKIDEILELPIRKFILLLERVDMKMQFEILSLASCFIKFDKPIKHWTSANEHDITSEITDVKTLEDKLKTK